MEQFDARENGASWVGLGGHVDGASGGVQVQKSGANGSKRRQGGRPEDAGALVLICPPTQPMNSLDNG